MMLAGMLLGSAAFSPPARVVNSRPGAIATGSNWPLVADGPRRELGRACVTLAHVRAEALSPRVLLAIWGRLKGHSA